MSKLFASAALAALVVGAPAMAQTTISGTYIATSRSFCQSTFVVNYDNVSGSGNFVDAVSGPQNGHVENDMGTATFNSSKHTVTSTTFDDEGDVALVQSAGAVTGNSGNPMQEKSMSGKTTYSNTPTTFTLGATTYNAFYGQADKNGIAHYMAFQGVSQNCTVQGEAVRQ